MTISSHVRPRSPPHPCTTPGGNSQNLSLTGARGAPSCSNGAILPRMILNIIKGPSAIFIANGPVGGVINQLSKSPASYEVRTLKIQAGLFDAQSTNLLTNAANPLVQIFKSLYQASIVYKPVEHVSVFYGYNENFAPNVQNNQVLPSQSGKQNEFGVKADLLDQQLTVNVAWFDIKQVNLTAPAFPQTTPPSSILIAGENSKGIDGDLSWHATKQLDLLGSIAFFNAEVPNIAAGNAPLLPAGNVSENTLGLWTRYNFEAPSRASPPASASATRARRPSPTAPTPPSTAGSTAARSSTSTSPTTPAA